MPDHTMMMNAGHNSSPYRGPVAKLLLLPLFYITSYTSFALSPR